MIDLSYFMNDKWKVLFTIYDNQIEIEGKKVCPLSQQEISNLTSCSKVKANRIINELIDNDYIMPTRIKGRYQINGKGEKAICVLLQLD